MELLAVSLSFEDLLPRLNITCFWFICGTVPLVSICDYRKRRRLSEPYFLSSEGMSFFHVGTATHILQFSRGTFPLNFVWLSHNALSLTINLLVAFYLPLPLFCVDWHTFLPLFLSGTVPLFFMWMSHKYPVCLHYLCVNVTHARLHFLCVNVTQMSLCLHHF